MSDNTHHLSHLKEFPTIEEIIKNTERGDKYYILEAKEKTEELYPDEEIKVYAYTHNLQSISDFLLSEKNDKDVSIRTHSYRVFEKKKESDDLLNELEDFKGKLKLISWLS